MNIQMQPQDGYPAGDTQMQLLDGNSDKQEVDLVRSLKPCDASKPFVFISYSEEDDDIVLKDVQELQRRRYNIWLYKANKQSTNSSWTEDTRQAIHNACCMLVVFYVSRNSLCSQPCLEELQEAASEQTKETHLGKPLEWIAVEAEPVEGNDIGTFIANTHRQLIANSGLSKEERNWRARTLTSFKKNFFPNNERNRILFRSGPERTREAYYKDIEEEFQRCSIEPLADNREESPNQDPAEDPASSPANDAARGHTRGKFKRKLQPREETPELSSLGSAGSEDAAKAETSGKLDEGLVQGGHAERLKELRLKLTDPDRDPETDPVRSAFRTLKEYAESLEELIRLEQWDLAQLLAQKADVLAQNGAADQAQAVCRNALTLYRGLRQEELTQEDLTQIYTLCRRLGMMEADAEAWTEAIGHCTEAMEGFAKLSEGTEDPQIRRSYYMSCYSLGEVYLRRGDPSSGVGEADQRTKDLKSAFTCYSRGFQCNRKLLSLDAATPADQEASNLVCGQIARILELLGREDDVRELRHLTQPASRTGEMK